MMIWILIERVVHLVTLVLLIIMISIIFSNNKITQDVGNFGAKVESVRQDNLKAISNNVEYFEVRINKLAETQDSYQVSTDQRVYVLEQRMVQLQSDKKNNQRVINNNVNTLTNY